MVVSVKKHSSTKMLSHNKCHTIANIQNTKASTTSESTISVDCSTINQWTLINNQQDKLKTDTERYCLPFRIVINKCKCWNEKCTIDILLTYSYNIIKCKKNCAKSAIKWNQIHTEMIYKASKHVFIRLWGMKINWRFSGKCYWRSWRLEKKLNTNPEKKHNQDGETEFWIQT